MFSAPKFGVAGSLAYVWMVESGTGCDHSNLKILDIANCFASSRKLLTHFRAIVDTGLQVGLSSS